MLSHKRVMVAMAALLLCPSPAAARDSFLKRMARQYTDSSSVAGLLPRASHGTVWESANAIDAFSIGEEGQKRSRRSDVRGTLPRSEHGTAWRRIDTLDAFTVFRDDEDSAADDAVADVRGTMPRSDHGTAWHRTDTLDSFTVFRDEDDSDAAEDAEQADVHGLIPGTRRGEF